MHDIMQYSKSENFKYLVIEASFGDYYGFNTKVKQEQEIATKIVSEYDDFMVKGWKVSKKLPKWVENANSWISFINGSSIQIGIYKLVNIRIRIENWDQSHTHNSWLGQ